MHNPSSKCTKAKYLVLCLKFITKNSTCQDLLQNPTTSDFVKENAHTAARHAAATVCAGNVPFGVSGNT